MVCGLLFLALVLWAGEPGVEFRPQAAQREPLQLRCPSGFSTIARGCGGAVFMSLVFPASLNMASSVKTSVQLFSVGYFG